MTKSASLRVWIYIISQVYPGGIGYSSPPVTDEAAEAQRDPVTCPGSGPDVWQSQDLHSGPRTYLPRETTSRRELGHTFTVTDCLGLPRTEGSLDVSLSAKTGGVLGQ